MGQDATVMGQGVTGIRRKAGPPPSFRRRPESRNVAVKERNLWQALLDSGLRRNDEGRQRWIDSSMSWTTILVTPQPASHAE